MDISTRLIQQIEQLPHARAARWVTGFLTVALLYLLAQITWKLIPSEQQGYHWSPSAISEQGSQPQQLDISSLLAMNLFGTVEQQAAEPVFQPVQKAPKTKLKLSLTGAVASDDPQRGAAIIESSGKQATYGVGDKIDGTAATVEEIYQDRVLLNHRGHNETLMLDGAEFDRSPPHAAAKTPRQNSRLGLNSKRVDKRNDTQVRDKLSVYRKELAENPAQLAANLTDFIKISPFKPQGELRGFRVNPGKQPELFRDMGLKANDLAVALNGMDLTDMSTAMQAANQLSELDEVALTVERNGQLHEILFSVPE